MDNTDSTDNVGRPVRIVGSKVTATFRGKTGTLKHEKNNNGRYGIQIKLDTVNEDTPIDVFYFTEDEFVYADDPEHEYRYKITELSTGRMKWRVEQTKPDRFKDDYWDFGSLDKAYDWCKDGIVEGVKSNCPIAEKIDYSKHERVVNVPMRIVNEDKTHFTVEHVNSGSVGVDISGWLPKKDINEHLSDSKPFVYEGNPSGGLKPSLTENTPWQSANSPVNPFCDGCGFQVCKCDKIEALDNAPSDGEKWEEAKWNAYGQWDIHTPQPSELISVLNRIADVLERNQRGINGDL